MRTFAFGSAGTSPSRWLTALGLGALFATLAGCSGGREEPLANDEAPGDVAPLALGDASPLGVAHGVILYSDGTTQQPTPEVLRHAQTALVGRLVSEATPEDLALLERELPSAAQSPTLNGLQPQGKVDFEQLAADAAVVDWLVARKEATPDSAVLQQLAGFLRNKLAQENAKEAGGDGTVGQLSFAIESTAGGAAYATACAAAGVPNPPPWRSASWVLQGSLTGNNNFVQPTAFAEVYTFTSASPTGVCIALPRRLTSSSPTYSVVGIICQGVNSSRSCFWDSKKSTTNQPVEPITTSETNLAVPGTKFVGGADLLANEQGVCTDCHAGENAFIIHPGSALELAPNTIAKNWVRPLIHPSWPQNTGPGSEMIGAGGACSRCHNKTNGTRFPRLEDLTAAGWCFVANTATGNTMLVSTPHESLLASGCATRAKATKFNTIVPKWHDNFAADAESPFVGDFNGDGRTDIITFLRGSLADAYVALSNGFSGFLNKTKWHDFFGLNGEQINIGDFNGDGRDDIITAVMNSAGTTHVATSTGNGFSASSIWNGRVLPGEVYHAGDFNGDRKDDIAIFTKGSTNDALIQLSNGSSFGSARLWHSNFSPGAEVPLVGDFNADGYDDIVTFSLGSTNDAWVSLSTGSGFSTTLKWHDTFGWPGEILRVADMNGDGKEDIVTFVPWTKAVYVALSTGTSFAPSTQWHSAFASTGQMPYVGDLDADHRADAIVFTKGAAADVFVSRAMP
jgi:hypothetical protein